MRQEPKRIMRMPDTNCIYPPDNEYAKKNEEIKSP